METERNGQADDPLMYAMQVVTQDNTAVSTIIRHFCATNLPSMQDFMHRVHGRITAPTRMRCIVYRTINPTFAIHGVYRDTSVNDRFRMSFTRFRLSAHNLAIESGRWNRRGRGRLPLEERMCVCGAIQTELHVVEVCPILDNVRRTYNLQSLEDLFNGKYNIDQSCIMCHKILNLYN
ncbi:hypothetical protein E2C01_045755 [Portunus trituberculatus]|uniref:Uncharacterized protein n=1 Tax=Portunus trituberculatus TaxID=210409 RepID=A0A5B7G3Z9_PORTR|nr:hypothetical protein [Portunus trituberculatus]